MLIRWRTNAENEYIIIKEMDARRQLSTLSLTPQRVCM